MSESDPGGPVARRFRGFMPVPVDVETGGFNAETDALLEIAAIILNVDENGRWYIEDSISRHIHPFEGANLDPSALEFTGIDPEHPFRRQIAVPERSGMDDVFRLVRKKVREHGCKRAILVGHNPSFDLGFLNAVVARTGIKRNPFHPFSTFDTATLGGVAYGQTVLSRAVQAAGLDWDSNEAHSALYDAERTAELFCAVVNRWDQTR